MRVLSIWNIGAWFDLELSSFWVSLILGFKMWVENVGCEVVVWSFYEGWKTVWPDRRIVKREGVKMDGWASVNRN